MKKYVYIIAATATIFASCSKENGVEENLNGEIRLTSANSEMLISRAGTSVQSTQFLNGEEISVFINEDVASNPATTYTQPLTYTANGSGGMTITNKQYFPQSGNGVNIYACYPKTVTEAVTTAKDFTVTADQSTDAAYKASDLMLGLPASNPVKRITTAVTLTFTHQLSKATVKLIAGDGLTDKDLNGATVKLKTLKPTISFNPKTGVTGGAKGTPADQTVMKAIKTDLQEVLTGSAVFVPQDIAENTNFIEVTLATGGILTYKLGAATTFASGKEYAYDITVRLTKLDVASTISDWTPIGKVTGDAEMLPPQTYAIGALYPNTTDPIGVVYTISDGGVHGKIVSLNETITDWSPYSVTTGATDANNGLVNMAKIKALDSAFSNYSAFAWCDAKNGTPGSTNYATATTGVWYLPAVNELKAVYSWWNTNRSGNNNIIQAARGNSIIEDFYWSSTESYDIQSACVHFFDCTQSTDFKNYSFQVRCVRAF